MKKINFLSSICLISLLNISYAEDTTAQDLSQAIHSINNAQAEVKKTGIIEPDCPGCLRPDTADQVVKLDKKTIDLEYLSFQNDNVPYVIRLKRTASSPASATLKFKIGHSECGQLYAGQSPLGPRGDLMVGCMFTHTVYEDHEIDLNLKKFPIPKGNENQIIDIKLSKPDIASSNYSLEAEVFKGPGAKVKKAKKWWSYGYSVEISQNN